MARQGRRSKRCLMCIKRKVKCDEQDPRCNRCFRAGLECPGYESRLKFVSENTRFPDGGTVSDENQEKGELPGCAVIAHQQRRIRDVYPSATSIFHAYTLTKLCPVAPAMQTTSINVLARLLAADDTRGPRPCVQALVTSYYGRMTQNKSIIFHGSQLYSRALCALHSAISKYGSISESDLLTDILCLCLYENIVLSHPAAWLSHYDAISRLIQSQGPQVFQRVESGIFRFCRLLCILSAGHLRRHCFLARSEWKSCRNISDETSPLPIDILYDIMAEVPGILHDFDMLCKTKESTDQAKSAALRCRTQTVIQSANTWMQLIPRAETSDPECYLDDLSKFLNISPPSSADAASLAFCYAMLLCLSDPCDTLHLSIIPTAPNHDNPIENNAKVKKLLAVEIGHLTTSAALRLDGLSTPAFFFIFPLQIARYHISPGSPEQERLKGLMDSVADDHGFEMGRMQDWDTLVEEADADKIIRTNFLRRVEAKA